MIDRNWGGSRRCRTEHAIMPIHAGSGEPVGVRRRLEHGKLAHIDALALVESDQLAKVVIGWVPREADMKAIATSLVTRDYVHAVEPPEERRFIALMKVANSIGDQGWRLIHPVLSHKSSPVFNVRLRSFADRL